MTARNGNGRGATATRSEEAPDHDVVVIGAGLSGIGTARKLRELGIEELVILEQADDIGGTWRDNTYPGLTVDIPTFTYQFPFQTNPEWERVFARGEEVKRYLDRVVDRQGLRPHLRLGVRVDRIELDEERHVWRLTTNHGPMTARFVVSALGVLTKPKLPDIEGLDEFEGKLIHTARWDHEHDLRGERAAVIGTGATAVQLIPEIAEEVERLHVFQRTPIWVFPKHDPEIPGPLRWAFKRVPGLARGTQLVSSSLIEVGMTVAVAYNRQLPWLTRLIERQGRDFLRSQVPDPELREKLTPRYGFGCKRPTMSNTYLRTFARGDAELVTEPIERVTPRGILTADGVERELDTLILATGYLTTEPDNAPPIPVHGRDGLNLRDFWRENRLQAYEGTSVPGFPNWFTIFGPYAFTGSSWTFMVDYQTTHIARVIREARKRGASLAEVRREPHERYFEEMLRRHRSTVFFNNGCATANSYYFDDHGDAPFLRPATAIECWWRARRFDLDDYRYEAVDAGMPAPAAIASATPSGS